MLYHTLLGQMAIVQSEKIKVGEPAHAIYRDSTGQVHTILIEPEMGELEHGDYVIVIAYKNETLIARKIPKLHGLF